MRIVRFQLVKFQLQGSKNLADAIVQVAGEFSAFFVLNLKHAAGQSANNLFGVPAPARLNYKLDEIENRKDQHDHEQNGKNQFLGGVGFVGNDSPLTEQPFFVAAQSHQFGEDLWR